MSTATSFIPQVKDESTRVERMFHDGWVKMAIMNRYPLNGIIHLCVNGATSTVEDEIGAELRRVQ